MVIPVVQIHFHEKELPMDEKEGEQHQYVGLVLSLQKGLGRFRLN
jgi:hypothetical protein